MKKDKKPIRIVWGMALIAACAGGSFAWADPVATQGENGSFTPVVSVDKPSDAPAEKISDPSKKFEDSSALTPPTDSLGSGKTENPSLKDIFNKLELDQNDSKAFYGYTESALKSIDEYLKTETALGSDLEGFRKQLEKLSGFAEEHPENKNVIKAVALAINAFFEHIEKSPASKEKENLSPENREQQNILQSLLDEEGKGKERNIAASADDLKQGMNAQLGESPEEARRRDQVMDTVLEVLRKGSINPEAPAFSRAVYRSWYLSLSKKARDMRLSRLRALVLRQQNAETPVSAL